VRRGLRWRTTFDDRRPTEPRLVAPDAQGAPVTTEQNAGVPWTDDLGLGVPPLDAGRDALIRLLDAYVGAFVAGRDREVIDAAFERILDHTHAQFRDEERLMRDAGFPPWLEHAEEHRRRTSELMRLNLDRDEILQADFGERLRDWLTDHVLGSDRRFARYLRALGHPGFTGKEPARRSTKVA
jgi:hemerythrin